MSALNENTSVPEAPIFEPFPEPNTMPSGWDLSGLVADPEPASVSSESDSAEA